jgi:hypothetical protein
MAYRSTKHGRPIETRNYRGYGFHWNGRDDRGISVWEGQTGALKWGVRILGALGVCEMLGALATWALGVPVAPQVLGGVGLLHLGLAYGGVLFMRRFAALATAEQLATDLHVEPAELEELVSGSRVRPKAIINGEPHYDPADFGEAATLLRAARRPDEELLRAAGGTASAEPGHLLRSADGLEAASLSHGKTVADEVDAVLRQGE